ncbi:MAG: TauD/TfdA family dioxygenase [Pseudomonadota bacterium]
MSVAENTFDERNAITIEPVTGTIGAIVRGLDLTSPDENTISVLNDALSKHLVIKLPGQNLDRFQLSKLGSKFGKHFLHPIETNGYDDCPEVLELLRNPEDATLFGGENWHADITWMNPVGYISILHALEIPEVGGDTAFASTIAAFESLSDKLKDILRGLTAINSYHWYDGVEKEPWVAEQPVVRKHPVTGQEGLYVTRMFTSRFSGMTVEESKPLLDLLFERMEEHQFTCRFRWQVGDVLMWDNRFTLHYPINDFSGQKRRMIRTSVLENTL